MRATRFAVAAVAALAIVASPGAAQAATITTPFHADSGDACRYGATDGTLGWQFGPTTSPLPVTAVAVKGKLTDRPLPADSTIVCFDDHYNSSATFVAYSGSVEVARQTRTANNGTVSFEFTLGNSTHTASISRVVIQVCRSPIITLPPSYCGTAVTYLSPPIG
ncbi:hypothetical protein [Micromonospora sp. NBC_01638]|uniref:hypothetical protein n=1 Tax=Micromonospora sp. NBC_01638 TaxID=2975982 RepID=UPI0038643386|nr:hypothetical protein OG811_24125 [Micromonospora sp. NBC_01638]